MKFTGKAHSSDITKQEISKKRYQPIVDDVEGMKVEAVKELIEVRDTKSDLPGWKKEEVVDFIHFLTTS